MTKPHILPLDVTPEVDAGPPPGLVRTVDPAPHGLLNGRLSPRTRELLVLRTAWNCQSEYEWGQHVTRGRKIGLHRDSEISDSTWTQLAEEYDDQEMIEVVMVVGYYHLVAMMLKSVGVPLDDGLPGF